MTANGSPVPCSECSKSIRRAAALHGNQGEGPFCSTICAIKGGESDKYRSQDGTTIERV